MVMKTDRAIRAAIYARVSTQEQAVEGTSLENQSDQLTNYCKAQGWDIVQKYVDPGYTGKDGNRPGLQHLLADAKLGLFEKVVVFKLDRLARKLRLLLEIEEKLKDDNVYLHSVKETLDTSTPIGRTVFQMLGLVSEWERETIIERTRAGRLQRYKEGCWSSGYPPFGYSYNRKTKKLGIDKPKAMIIRRIFQEYASGKSMIKIATMLNDERIATRRKDGKGWRSGSIRGVLLNPIYKGTQVVNTHQHCSQPPSELQDGAIKIKVPPIVNEHLWNIAQERRKNNKHLHPTQNGHWLLQGLISCGLCGYCYASAITHRKRRYSCRGRLRYTHMDGSPRCTSPRLDADWLEEQIWQRIEAIINDPNRLESLLKDTVENLKNREADLNARIKPIDTRLTEIIEQKSRLAEDWVRANINSDNFRELQQKLEQEETRLRSIRNEIDPAQLEELERTQSMLRFWDSQLQAMSWNTENEDGSMVRVVDRPHKTALRLVGFEDKDITNIMHFPATRRELLDLLQVRVVVFDDRVEVKAIFPIEPIDCQVLNSTCKSSHSRLFQ